MHARVSVHVLQSDTEVQAVLGEVEVQYLVLQ